MAKDTGDESLRLFAYCHDGVGIGHLARTAAICERLHEDVRGLSFLIATGTPYVALFENLRRSDYIKLPALEKLSSKAYRSKFFPSLPSSAVLSCRASMIRSSVEYFAPNFVLVDKAPLGVCGELVPTLSWLRSEFPKTRIVFGMRDVEDAPETTIAEWTEAGVIDRLDELFDDVWVYGMRELFDVAAEYRFPPSLNGKVRYMGYVAPPTTVSHSSASIAEPFVLVTVGGGTDGELLLATYLDDAAQRMGRAGIRSVVVSGPDLPEEAAERLGAKARALSCVEWVKFEPRMNERIQSARLVVSMGGYNTLCQIALHGKRALVVPRIKPRKEQLIRANLWSGLGAIEVLPPDQLSPRTLAERVESMLDTPSPGRCRELDFGGLDRVAHRFRELTSREIERATPVRV